MINNSVGGRKALSSRCTVVVKSYVLLCRHCNCNQLLTPPSPSPPLAITSHSSPPPLFKPPNLVTIHHGHETGQNLCP